MHFIVNIFFIALFMFASFYMKYPDLYTQNFIRHKIIIFFLLFCFQYILDIIFKIKNKCRIYPGNIAIDSLIVGLSAVIGYTIFNDLLYQGAFTTYIDKMYFNPKVLYLNITLIIIVCISIGLMFKKSLYCNNVCSSWNS